MNGLQFGNFRPALIVESEQSHRIGHQDLLQFRIVRRVAVEQFEQVCVVRRLHGRYVIGRQVSELALARQSRSPLLVAAEPYLAKVSAQLGDTLFLTVRTGLDTLCVARRIGSYPIQVLSIEVGARRQQRRRRNPRRAAGAGRAENRRGQSGEVQVLPHRRAGGARPDLGSPAPPLRTARHRPGAGNEVAFGLDQRSGRRARRGHHHLGGPPPAQSPA